MICRSQRSAKSAACNSENVVGVSNRRSPASVSANKAACSSPIRPCLQLLSMLPDKPGWELGGLVAEVWISPAHCAAAFAPGLVFRSFYLREARCARVVLHCYCGITTHGEPIGKVALRIRRLWLLLLVSSWGRDRRFRLCRKGSQPLHISA